MFLYNLSRSSYRKEWGHDYEQPGVRARMWAFVLRIVPKVGPFKLAKPRAIWSSEASAARSPLRKMNAALFLTLQLGC